jgi:hypothetical protein
MSAIGQLLHAWNVGRNIPPHEDKKKEPRAKK